MRHVLIVDDRSDNRYLLRALLPPAAASSGAAVEASARATAER